MSNTNTITPDRRRAALMALLAIAEAIIDTVKSTGSEGAPGGVIYAALMHFGISHEQFEGIMAGCVDAGKVVKIGDLYFAPTDKVISA